MPQRQTAQALRVCVMAVTAAAALSVLPAAASPAAPAAPAATTVAPAGNVIPAGGAVAAARVTSAAEAAAADPGAARRSNALAVALDQLGKPYVWGATGPSAFDCSGLVSYAFGQTGQHVPRTSRAQSAVGTPVSRANLKPGDLVFFYSPVSHVGIYVGDGQVVHASTSGLPVKISHVDDMPFNSAKRI